MEQVLYDANPPVFRNNPMIFAACVAALVIAASLSADVPQLLLAVSAGCILVWLFLFLISKSQRLIVTGEEVRFEKGILAKARTELSLKSVRSIKVNQSFFQRILGVATVEFFSAGDIAEISVKGLPDPHRIRELVDG